MGKLADLEPQVIERLFRAMNGHSTRRSEEIAMQTVGSEPDSPSTAILTTLPVTANGHPGNLGWYHFATEKILT